MASSTGNLFLPRLNKIENLDVLCRLCLRSHEKLVDFFESGICDKILEVTHLKLDMYDDLMPKKVCMECHKKVEETYEFVCRIKFSEELLKSQLEKRQTIYSLKKKDGSFGSEKEDELIVILVPNLTRDASFLHEDGIPSLKETNYDHTYPKEININEDASIIFETHENILERTEEKGKSDGDTESVFYTCNRCNGLFEAASEFLSHFNACYEKIPCMPPASLTCPICSFSETNKNLYLEHLKDHKSEGLMFFKFDPNRDELPTKSPKDSEHKVFKICLRGGECGNCGKYLASLKSFFADHGRECEADFENSKGKFALVYECPVCGKDWIDDQTGFVKHLSWHRKKDGVNFVKVARSGIPVPPKKSEIKAFLNVKKARKFASLHQEASFSLKRASSRAVVVAKVIFERTSLRYDDCDACPSSLRSKSEMAQHLKLHYLGEVEGGIVCERCGKKFIGSVSYEKHFSSKHPAADDSCRKKLKYRPSCDLCGKTFANGKKLGAHFELHHQDRKGESNEGNSKEGVVCEICGTKFSKNSGLSKHKKLHSIDDNPSLIKCKICDRSFSNTKTFERHLAAHLNPNYFDCEVCKLPLPSASGLEKHSTNAHGGGSSATHDCDVCNLSFLSKDALTCHRARTGHRAVGDAAPFECNVCHEKFYVGKKFARHVKLHPKYKTTECGLCGKRLSTFQSLALHIDRHYESNGILCPKCGKRFFEERNYRRHLLTHKGIRPYPCDVQGCQKSFYTLFEIKRHKKYHFDTRDFPCPHCAKRFHESNHLKVHIRTHTGEKPYVCPHCQKGFVTRTRCKQHIKLIHQGIGYELIRSDISKKVAVFEAS